MIDLARSYLQKHTLHRRQAAGGYWVAETNVNFVAVLGVGKTDLLPYVLLECNDSAPVMTLHFAFVNFTSKFYRPPGHTWYYLGTVENPELAVFQVSIDWDLAIDLGKKVLDEAGKVTHKSAVTIWDSISAEKAVDEAIALAKRDLK